MNEIESYWTTEHSNVKFQYDNCKSKTEVARLTAKLTRQSERDQIDTPTGAIKFFSQTRIDQLGNG